ncbi:DUF6009 family protein [Streptomyces sp. NPDC051976]|uniref:DUF6009 family protein n=1 Tax=Streptomyces sp. NPDC051976 TaxID=3154947 RepID=UPI003443A8F5
MGPLRTADAEANPDSGLFQRRTFFLLPHGRPQGPHGLYQTGAPDEAVAPRTIQPRRVGEETPAPRATSGLPSPDAALEMAKGADLRCGWAPRSSTR